MSDITDRLNGPVPSILAMRDGALEIFNLRREVKSVRDTNAAAIAAMRQAMDALDAEIERQELTGVDDEEIADLANAADGLRVVLRAAGEPV